MRDFLHSDLTRVEHFETGFTDGTQPDWLYNNVVGAGASVTYEPIDDGRAKIDTGTDAIGEGVEILFGVQGGSSVGVSLDKYDVCIMSAEVVADAGTARSALKLNDSNKLEIFKTYDVVNDGGADYNVPVKDWTKPRKRINIIWDIHRDVAWGAIGGMVSAPIDPPTADPSAGDYKVRFLDVKTTDTSSNWNGYLYSCSLSLFRR